MSTGWYRRRMIDDEMPCGERNRGLSSGRRMRYNVTKLIDKGADGEGFAIEAEETMMSAKVNLRSYVRLLLSAVVAISIVSMSAPARASDEKDLWWERPESVSGMYCESTESAHVTASDHLPKPNAGTANLPARPTRQIIPGKVKAVELTSSSETPDVVGVLQVTRNDGESFRFRVYTCTLILIRDAHGRLWAGRLEHLKPGWVCEVAFDLPPDEDDNSDFRSDDVPLIDAANIIADSVLP